MEATMEGSATARAKVGFTPYAEKLNGRLAMIGFISVLAFEVITGQGLLQWFMNL
jgi:hypothetical protein